ncbi:MAG: GIY-YIG nuclease family protein [Nibricoccus sp.]
MPSNQPFTLHIFVVNGDPDGLRVIERSNWNGKAVVFPRSLYPHIKNRDEFSHTGVYLLLGPREDGEGDALYIGEGDPVRPRIESHYVKKDFWTRAVFFVGGLGKLNKAHVQFLEAQLVARAKAAKRLLLENGNDPTEPTLSEADRAAMEVFLDNMLGMLPVLGVDAFEKAKAPSSKTSDDGALHPAPVILTCRGKGVIATGYETTQGFLVKASSMAVGLKDEAPSLAVHVPTVYKARREAIRTGVLQADGDRFRFVEDYVFNSPSLAAAVIFGRSANGRIEWKDSSGKTLKQLQIEQAIPALV